ncbi:MAG: hypothetical protein HY791_18840 [Deltaproteobacteria bacterium]|nr:hypothetical protein [Deltaproteobacteria bacterium]
MVGQPEESEDESDWDQDDASDDLLHDGIDEIVGRFEDSLEGQDVFRRLGYGGSRWVGLMLDYAASHHGVGVDMSGYDFSDVLFRTIPRKVSCEPREAPEIVDELRAFWQFRRREFGSTRAGECLSVLDSKAAKRLEMELSDTSNFGMAKSFFMLGSKMGYDMTTQEGLDAWTLAYNQDPSRFERQVPDLFSLLGFGRRPPALPTRFTAQTTSSAKSGKDRAVEKARKKKRKLQRQLEKKRR